MIPLSHKARLGGVVALVALLALSALVAVVTDAGSDEITTAVSQEAPTSTADTPAQEAPKPPETGNAGLKASTETSVALAITLGIFAVAMVAGGRTATRRS